MTYGYMNSKNGKYNLLIPRAKAHSSSPTASKEDYGQITENIRIDEIKAKATSTPLHLTLG